MYRKSLAITALLLLYASTALAKEVKILYLGNTPVNVVIHNNGPGLTYINLHDDENTCVIQAKKLPGTVIELQHSGQKNITFVLNGVTYIIDPNRMFTNTGITKSLKKLSSYSIPAHNAIYKFVQDFLKIAKIIPYDPSRTIITIHNNTDENYSAWSYLNKLDTEQIYMTHKFDADDFFYVNDLNIFNSLKNYNIVLQHKQRVRQMNSLDDGSLSVYATKKRYRYINIEAQHEHGEVQLRMLEAVHVFIQR